MMKNRLIIADIASHNSNGKSFGHYFAVAENYSRVLGCTIAGGPIYRSKFEDALILPYDGLTTDNVVIKKWKQLMNCRALFRATQGGTVILQHAALATAIFGTLLFKKKHTKLFLITYNDEGYNRPFMRFFYNMAKRKVNGVICPFEFVGRGYDLPAIVVPDYLYCEDQFQTLSKVDKKYDLCVIGNITPEKGVREVIDLAIQQSVSLIVAGRPASPELEKELQYAVADHKNITAKFKFLSEEEYLDIINSSLYCVLNYQDKSYSTRSSGVAYDLLFRGTPIIGRRCTALNYIEEKGMGVLFDNIANVDLKELLKLERVERFKKGIYQYTQLHKHYIRQLKVFISE